MIANADDLDPPSQNVYYDHILIAVYCTKKFLTS